MAHVEESKSREDEILGGKNALPTILKLSVGPFFSQVTISAYGFINTLWLAKACSRRETAALSTAASVDSITMSFGFFFAASASTKIASLFGEHRKDEAQQILCDLIRISIIAGIIMPAVLIPCLKPLLRWFGASADIVGLGMDYLTVLLACSVISSFYLLLCGVLQAEGRTLYFAVIQVISMALNGGVFDPLFLIPCKLGIRGASLSIVASQLLPCIYLFYCFFRGHFTTKLDIHDFVKNFHPETLETLKIGLPSLVGAVSATLPGIFFQKFIGLASEGEEEFNTMMSLYNAYSRIYAIAIALFMAITSGFLPCASFAFAAGRFRRVLFLLAHSVWLVISIAAVFQVALFSFTGSIASIFDSTALFIERFKKCLHEYWSTTPFCALQYIITALLQATDHTTMAFIVSIVTQLCMWPSAAAVLYFTDKKDVCRLYYSGMANDICSILFALPFAIYVLVKIICPGEQTLGKLPSAQDVERQENGNDNGQQPEEITNIENDIPEL